MIVLDTCAVIWDALEPAKISKKASELITKAEKEHNLFVSDITWWEIAMLVSKGRLQFPVPVDIFTDTYCAARTLGVKCISPKIAATSVQFCNSINADPADRIILATALEHKARLITADRNLRANKIVSVVW